jgi:hypothetical protein
LNDDDRERLEWLIAAGVGTLLANAFGVRHPSRKTPRRESHTSKHLNRRLNPAYNGPRTIEGETKSADRTT